MYAIIRNKDGTFYKSLVFGCFIEKYSGYNYYFYIVFDEKKRNLIKKYVFDKKSKYLDPQVLIVDCDVSYWNVDKDLVGQVKLFDENLLEKIENNSIKTEELSKCKELDEKYIYEEFQELKDEQDIKNLNFVSGNFHDAYVSKVEHENGYLSVLFKGVWGCSIEFHFSEAVSINLHEEEIYDSYWSESNMYFDNGYFCLIDEENKIIDRESNGYRWFMAKKAKYRVIPNTEKLK